MAAAEMRTTENELFDIWKCCFGDENSVISSFFDHVYDSSLCLSEKRDGKIVSALHLIPCRFHRKDCFYLYAAATLEEYRGRGIMSQLVLKTRETAKRHNAAFIYLYPANNSLYGFYEKLGFSHIISATSIQLDAKELPKTDGVHLCSVQEFYDLLLKNAKLFHAPVPERRILPYLSAISLDTRFSYCMKYEKLCALAACEIRDGQAVSVFADAADGCLEQLLSAFGVFGADKYTITLPSGLSENGLRVDNGMLMSVSGEFTPQPGMYSGLNMF